MSKTILTFEAPLKMKQALKRIARRHATNTSTIIRQAIFAAHGEELKDLIEGKPSDGKADDAQ